MVSWVWVVFPLVLVAQVVWAKLRGVKLIGEITFVPGGPPVAAAPAGFSEIGHFKIPQFRGLRMSAWWSEEHSLCALAFEGAGQALWWDLMGFYPDGSSLTYSTRPPSGLDQCPRHRNVNCPGLDVPALLQECLQNRPERFCGLFSGDFVNTYRRIYRESINWRRIQGVTAREVERVAAASGRQPGNYDAESVAQEFTARNRR